MLVLCNAVCVCVFIKNFVYVKLIYHFKHWFHWFGYHVRAILRRESENQRKFHQVKWPRCAWEFIASQGPWEINTGKHYNQELLKFANVTATTVDDEWTPANSVNPVCCIIYRCKFSGYLARISTRECYDAFRVSF